MYVQDCKTTLATGRLLILIQTVEGMCSPDLSPPNPNSYGQEVPPEHFGVCPEVRLSYHVQNIHQD